MGSADTVGETGKADAEIILFELEDEPARFGRIEAGWHIRIAWFTSCECQRVIFKPVDSEISFADIFVNGALGD